MKGQAESANRRTVEFFKDNFEADISSEEARQINENLAGIYTLLAKWDREQAVSKYGATETTGDCHVG